MQDAWLTALPPFLCGRVCSPPLHACNAWLVKAMAGSGESGHGLSSAAGEGGEAASGPCRPMRSGRRHRGGGALTQPVSGLITAASGAPLPAGVGKIVQSRPDSAGLPVISRSEETEKVLKKRAGRILEKRKIVLKSGE